jgi:hypothetical protein
MFKRVITVNIEGRPEPVVATTTYGSLEAMELDPPAMESTAEDNGLSISVEEYEDDDLIRSYEGLDPTRSTEYVLSTIGDNKKYFGIYVFIYTRDEHDELNPVNEPPHIHIYNLNKDFICKLNITGECPRTIAAMRPCMFKINGKLKKAEISTLIPKMVIWADHNRTTDRGIIKNWDFAKKWWEKYVGPL